MFRKAVLILIASGTVGGCRLPRPESLGLPATPTSAVRHAGFPPVQPVRYEPGDHALPHADPGTNPPPKNADGFTFRGVIEAEAQCQAAQHTSIANLLDQENQAPTPEATRRHRNASAVDPSEGLQRQVRMYTALELRNRSAGEALERYFQLADAEARSALLRDALPILDDMRELAAKAKAAGVRYPIEAEDVDRQRSQFMAQVEQATAGTKMLNVDLRRRLGLPWAASERLWPTGNFDVIAEVMDEDVAVQAAVANRPELQGMRALEAGLTAETLPAVRDLLRTINPMLGGSPLASAAGSMQRLVAMLCPNREDPNAERELATRRQQIQELRAERERAIADEARAAAALLNSQVPRIALARGRAESWKAKVEDAKKQRAANIIGSDLLEAQAGLEWLKARAEVTAEVMAWQQSRVRLKAAQGKLAWECAPEGFDPSVVASLAGDCGTCARKRR